jgi:hypothetical protein
VLIHASGFNLGLVMRHLLGIETPRGFQGRVAALVALLVSLYRAITWVVSAPIGRAARSRSLADAPAAPDYLDGRSIENRHLHLGLLVS